MFLVSPSVRLYVIEFTWPSGLDLVLHASVTSSVFISSLASSLPFRLLFLYSQDFFSAKSAKSPSPAYSHALRQNKIGKADDCLWLFVSFLLSNFFLVSFLFASAWLEIYTLLFSNYAHSDTLCSYSSLSCHFRYSLLPVFTLHGCILASILPTSVHMF